jgi:leucyl-tRNA synthetase
MPKTQFNPAEIQSKYNKIWQESKIYQTPDFTSTKPKKYILDAFAYPSGIGIHAGHAEGYIATDILARYYRQSGYDVLFPVGFDSFGLPAENYAIKTGVHPRINTDTTIKYYCEQITALGSSNDWADQIGTHTEDYYKWTQWFFGLLYSRGLAYKKNALVNWDPVDQTVLANEQVLADGTAERSGAKVEQKMMSQWFFKITDYAEKLLIDLDKVDWPESTKLMQKNWIGKSVGAEVDFVINKSYKLEVFGKKTFGATESKKSYGILFDQQSQKYGVIQWNDWNKVISLVGGTADAGETELETLVREVREESGYFDFEKIIKLETKLNVNYYSNLKNVNTNSVFSGYAVVINPDNITKKQLESYESEQEIIWLESKDVLKRFEKSGTDFDDIYNQGSAKLFQMGVTELINAGYDTTTNLDNIKILYQEGSDHISTDTTPNYLFIHGWEGSNKSNYLPEIKETFDRLGLAIQIPSLPNSANPNVLEQAKYILDNCKLDSNTVIVAHSLGVAVGLKVLESLDKHIAKFISIAGFVSTEFHRDTLPKGINDPFDFASFDFDFHKIKNRCRQFVGLWSEDDQYITLEQVSKLESALDFEVDKVSGYKHLNNLSQKVVQDKILDKITVFTTAHDTIFGTSFLVLAPEHELVDSLTTSQHFDKVQAYKQQAKSKSQFERTEMNKDKSGVWTGSYVINPVNGNKIQVWVADYVLTNYGTGAVMGVPGEDERDFEFATKYGLPIIYTNNTNSFVSYSQEIKPNKSKYTLINSGKFDGMTYEIARPLILEELAKSGCGEAKITYRLRDWLVSRQRYWGSPIPVVYTTSPQPSPKGEGEIEMLVPESDLPVILPNDVEFKPSGRSPLIDHEEFHASAKAKYGPDVRREVDTMDTFVCSSWYMFRFMDPHNPDVFASPERMSKWGPIDEYVIGAEHCVLHLLYARFFTKVLFDAGYIDFDEPFTKVTHPGIILGSDNRKMSKRWGNVINPMDVVDELGADALRLYVMFMGPFEQSKPWNVNSLRGVKRFLDRVWKMQDLVYNTSPQPSPKVEGVPTQISYITELAREMRKSPTSTEAIMWEILRNRNLDGLKFKRQQPFSRYIADFYCHELSLIIELDGDIHLKTADYDNQRSKELEGLNLKVVRFSNDEISNDLNKVLSKILSYKNIPSHSGEGQGEVKLDSTLHKLIKKVGDDIVDYSFNTSVAEFMKFVNLVEEVGSIRSEQLSTFLKVLAPFAPYITEEMYQTINSTPSQEERAGVRYSIHLQPFPSYDKSKLVETEVTIGVQINGKVRGELTLSPTATEEEAKELVIAKDFVIRNLEGKQIKKFIYKAGKIINVIIG